MTQFQKTFIFLVTKYSFKLTVSTYTCTLILHCYSKYVSISNLIQVTRIRYSVFSQYGIFRWSHMGYVNISQILGAFFVDDLNWALGKLRFTVVLRHAVLLLLTSPVSTLSHPHCFLHYYTELKAKPNQNQTKPAGHWKVFTPFSITEDF